MSSTLSSSALIQFLCQSRSALLPPPPCSPLPGHYPTNSTTTPTSNSIAEYSPAGQFEELSTTLVLGNPSCDLDSFVSATVYAFAHSIATRIGSSRTSDRFDGGRSGSGNGSRTGGGLYVPVLNPPSTLSRDLWRLRPEFGVALRLAVSGVEGGKEEEEEGEEEKQLLENLVTVSDITSSPSSSLYSLFTEPRSSSAAPQLQTPVVLVDHNLPAISVPDLPSKEIRTGFDVVGCIDHHIDEGVVPTAASPRIIQTGIGSCTTLVVKHLREQGFWDLLLKESKASEDRDHGRERDRAAAVELAKLSLAAILIDTANLTADGKVSSTDEDIVAFLENIILKPKNSTNGLLNSSATHWSRQAFYDQLASTKSNSLTLLTLPEIFGRDYKAWSESAASSSSPAGDGKPIHLGISSIVKPISWLVRRNKSNPSIPSSAEDLIQASRDFAAQEGLDILVLMTSFSIPAGNSGETRDKEDDTPVAKDHFQRELCLLPTIANRGGGDEASVVAKAIQIFEDLAKHELGLEDWADSCGFTDLLTQSGVAGIQGGDQEGGLRPRVWTQSDTSKSRKQVAPLLREAIRRALS